MVINPHILQDALFGPLVTVALEEETGAELDHLVFPFLSSPNPQTLELCPFRRASGLSVATPGCLPVQN